MLNLDYMKIEIIREKRKTIMLKLVDSENAVLKVPKDLSEKKINDFVESKKAWLEKTSRSLKRNEDFSKEFNFDEFVYLFGQKTASVNEIALDFLNQTAVKKRKLIKSFYLSHFDELLKIASQISATTGLKYSDIKPIDSVRIWGSYNANGVMKLNWKLLILPKDLCEYVICHELCHSLHMNHKPKFWVDVEKICPNYKNLRKQLTTYGFLLKKDL